MQKIDRLGWAAGIAIDAWGVNLGVRVNEPAAMAHVMPLLPPGWTEAPSPAVEYVLSLIAGGEKRRGVRTFSLAYGGAAQLARERSVEAVLSPLRQGIDRRIAKRAPDHLFLQGAAVAVEDTALVIVGPSGSGKSALLRALLAGGADYLSDTYAVLDDAGAVHAYPRPLAGYGEDGGEGRPPNVASGPLPLGAIVHLGAGERSPARIRRLSRPQNALRLIPFAPIARARPDFATGVLSALPRDAEFLQMHVADPAETAGWLLNEFAQAERAG